MIKPNLEAEIYQKLQNTYKQNQKTSKAATEAMSYFAKALADYM